MKILYQGAESIIYEENNKIIKDRIRKSYRIPQIDILLRGKRTKREVRLISEARRLGISVPRIIETTNKKIIMENVVGKRLKELINNISEAEKNNISAEQKLNIDASENDNMKRAHIAKQVGSSIAKMHIYNIIHGDLTTSNLILKDNKIYFIDFGLGFFSKRIEDKATDLAVLKEALKSTHFKYLNTLWENIIQGYKSNPEYKKVLKCLENIEKRGRYVKR